MVFSVLLVMPVSTYAAYSLPVDVEAEDCTLGNGAVVTTNVYGTQYPGYSGDGFVWVANSGTITLEVTIPENGMYELSTRCWMYLGKEDETRMQVISINGKSQATILFQTKANGLITVSDSSILRPVKQLLR